MGTLPLFAVLPIKDKVRGAVQQHAASSAAALVVTGFLLFASDRVKKGRKNGADGARLLDALARGRWPGHRHRCPGISRSGTTITAGCFVGFERKFAVRFSFLLSIPAVLGANILSLKDAIAAGVDWGQRAGVSGGRGWRRRCPGTCASGLLRHDRQQGQIRLRLPITAGPVGLLTIVLQLIKLRAQGFVMCVWTTKKKTTGKARQGGELQSRQSGRPLRRSKRPARPIRREVGGGVCLLLALCVVVSYFQADGHRSEPAGGCC